MILAVWDGLPSVDIVIGGEVFLCMTEQVLGAGHLLVELSGQDKELLVWFSD